MRPSATRWAVQAMAASAQPTILKGLSALPPSRPRYPRVEISGPRPNNAIRPVVPDYTEPDSAWKTDLLAVLLISACAGAALLTFLF
jgi:hypothetical protein